jgi:hypothetical protein
MRDRTNYYSNSNDRIITDKIIIDSGWVLSLYDDSIYFVNNAGEGDEYEPDSISFKRPNPMSIWRFRQALSSTSNAITNSQCWPSLYLSKVIAPCNIMLVCAVLA